MIAWMKRYSSISIDEIHNMTSEEFQWFKEGLEKIIKRENPK